MRNRLTLFNAHLSGSGSPKPSKYLKEIIDKTSHISIEILEIVKNEESIRGIEDIYLKQHSNNPFLLNRSKDAFSNKGIKWTKEERKTISDGMKTKWNSRTPEEKRLITEKVTLSLREKYKGIPKKERINNYIKKGPFKPPPDYVYPFSKTIHQYEVDGTFVMSHKSISEAAKHVGVGEKIIRSHIKNYRVKGVRGFVFREEGGVSGFEKITKKAVVKIEELPPIVPHAARYIIDVNTGVFYYSVRELRGLVSIKEKNLYAMLSGRAENKTKYRYA